MSLTVFEFTEAQVSCRRSTGLRVGSGLLSMFLGAVCLALLHAFWLYRGSLADRSPADVLSQSFYFLILPLFVLCGPTAFFLYFAGPADLVVDASQRTYRFRRGFPLLAAWQSGSLEDIAGLRIITVERRSTFLYQMMLDWKNTRAAPWTPGDGAVSSRRPFQMMSSEAQSCVQDEARRLAARLGVPLQEDAPIWDAIRSRTSCRLVPMFGFLFFILIGLPRLIVAYSLGTEGQPAKGTVALRDGDGDIIRYTYSVGGRAFTGHAPMPWSLYSSLAVGDLVSVRYLPAHPHTSTIIGAADAGGPALLMAGLLLVVFAVPSRRPRRQLFGSIFTN